uniref:NADH-ubiquinone oxidoreductase chain 5 n=1 Tax=Cymothoa indica TaxID=439382 RepID=A0A344H249_9CRUS|nr:NADH dehydrogenase subunit 5 [Cymothoa indica]
MFTIPPINTIILTITTLGSLTMFLLTINLISSNNSSILILQFFKSSSSDFEFTIVVDPMSTIFSSLVLLISSAVIHYSASYMQNDNLNKRFTLLVFTFISSMMLLIFALNLIAIILGWDGLGLTSFILVAYYQNKKTNAASMLTALSNRIGDSAIIIAIALLVKLNMWNITQMPNYTLNISTSSLIILAAMTKSAQIPFSAWLPAAMAAPTPVSALVHSSTLVTAGIYLLIRFHPMLEKMEWLLPMLAIVGLMTSIMASISGCLETNLKKTVALSTLSQLGIMTFSLSSNMVELAFFHLLMHAIFKALLFIACGKMIHDAALAQDIRLMGNMMSKTPFTWMALNISNFALCGMPFLAGFYSKDPIFEMFFMNFDQPMNSALLSLAIASSTIYSTRMMFASMINLPMTPPLSNTSETDLTAMTAMKMLIIPAIIGGSSLSWVMFPTPLMITIPLLTKLTPLMMILGCFTLGITLSLWKMKPPISHWIEPVMQMWFLPTISPSPSSFTLSKSNETKNLDMGWFEMMSAQGLFSTFMTYSSNITKIQTTKPSLFLTTSALFMIFMMTM